MQRSPRENRREKTLDWHSFPFLKKEKTFNSPANVCGVNTLFLYIQRIKKKFLDIIMMLITLQTIVAKLSSRPKWSVCIDLKLSNYIFIYFKLHVVFNCLVLHTYMQNLIPLSPPVVELYLLLSATYSF